MHRDYVYKTIYSELEKLRSILESAPEKITEIIQEFSEHTPGMLAAIVDAIGQAKPEVAAATLHKVKVRYSYLGFEEVYEKMQQWELSLKAGKVIIGMVDEVKKIQSLTATIIEVLKSIDVKKLSEKSYDNPHLLVGKKVLVAEDDEINAMVFEAFIQELGGEILVAQDGFDAINQATENSPDLIFMDVHMPYCSGLDAIKTLRSRGVTTPIISLSASSRLNEKDESFQAGANDFLTKPANRHTIKQVLLKHIR